MVQKKLIFGAVIFRINHLNAFPRSLETSYIETHNIKCVTTSWTYSILLYLPRIDDAEGADLLPHHEEGVVLDLRQRSVLKQSHLKRVTKRIALIYGFPLRL